MFSWYKDLIEKLFSAVFERSGEVVSFLDFLSVIGFSLLLVLAFLLILAIMGGAFGGPFFAYRKCFLGLKSAISSFDENSSLEEFQTIKRKLRIRQILYWFVFAFFYLPIAIPSVLYVLSLIFSLFS